jgi:hypothetical protein
VAWAELLAAVTVRRWIRLLLFVSAHGEHPIEFPLFSSLRSALHPNLSQFRAPLIWPARSELSAGHVVPEASSSSVRADKVRSFCS